MVLEHGNSKIKAPTGWCLIRNYFLVHTWLSSVYPNVEGMRETFGVLIKVPFPFVWAPASWPTHFSKVPPPNGIIMGVIFQQVNCAETQAPSLWHNLSGSFYFLGIVYFGSRPPELRLQCPHSTAHYCYCACIQGQAPKGWRERNTQWGVCPTLCEATAPPFREKDFLPLDHHVTLTGMLGRWSAGEQRGKKS